MTITEYDENHDLRFTAGQPNGFFDMKSFVLPGPAIQRIIFFSLFIVLILTFIIRLSKTLVQSQLSGIVCSSAWRNTLLRQLLFFLAVTLVLTLAEKRARVRVPVGVAYGSDITTVMKILLACAEANPTVLSNPKPQALFLAFGSSSLDFELRVWIADFSDRRTTLSELNIDIESEFQSTGIELPFPQTDLHLRTVDQEAADVLQKGVA